MKTGAVIVAAGLSSRMGGFKPMLKIGSITIVRRIILTLRQAGADPIALVTGNHAELLERHVSRMGVVCLRNARYADSQMFDSAKIGLAYLKDRCGQVLFTPVDIPLFTVNTTLRLIANESPVASPVCNGKEGHPLLISTRLIPSILEYSGDEGLAGAVRECGQAKRLVEVEDEGVLFDMDTQEAYQELLDWHNRQLLRPQTQVRLAREEPFFGPGTAMLLKLIRQTESVKTACQTMGLSYSKGWNMLKQMERQLGYPVIDRRQGGLHGGSARLTARGETLVERYERFEKESEESVQMIFDRIFGEEF